MILVNLAGLLLSRPEGKHEEAIGTDMIDMIIGEVEEVDIMTSN